MPEAIDAISKRLSALLLCAGPSRLVVHAHVEPKRRAVGKRAKRQAFYDRRRIERSLDRIWRGTVAAGDAAFNDALLDVFRFGFAWIESADGGLKVTRRHPPDVMFQPFDPVASDG